MPNKTQRLKKQARLGKKTEHEKLKEDKRIQEELARMRERYFSIDPVEASRMLF
jgi:hypothetical protein